MPLIPTFGIVKTFIYYIAEKIAGQQEMQRFAQPIHVGIITAENVVEAYESVLGDLAPTFADHPQPLEARFEEMAPPAGAPKDASPGTVAGIWKHRKPIDMDITFTDAD